MIWIINLEIIKLAGDTRLGESEAGCRMGLDFKIVLTNRRNTFLMRRDQIGSLQQVNKWTQTSFCGEKQLCPRQGRWCAYWHEEGKSSPLLWDFFCGGVLAFGCDKEKNEPLWEKLQKEQDDFLEVCQMWHFEDRLNWGCVEWKRLREDDYRHQIYKEWLHRERE